MINPLGIIGVIIKNRLGIVQYPSFITFLITWRCNCRCIMCDIWKKEKSDELTLDEIERIFNQLKTIDVIRISGGEPFLRNDLAEIINIIDEKVRPKLFHITTNGLLKDQIIKTLKRIKPIRKVHLKISIDDVGEAHNKIRGVENAYEKALSTVEELSKLRKELCFYLGVNQTIVDEKGIESYSKLKSVFKVYGVGIFPVVAYKQRTALYSGENIIVNPETSYKTYGIFSKDKLSKFIKFLIKEAGNLNNFQESLIKKYYLKGIYKRLVRSINKPNPKCVALNNHLRILPNGDVPICMYNSTIVGNLKKEKLKDIWFNNNTKKHRQWVKKCNGCWASCESNVNAIYSGDIWKGII